MPAGVTREQHMAWLRERALAALDADPDGSGPALAVASVLSDLRTHRDADPGGVTTRRLGELMIDGRLVTAAQVRELVAGMT